jgi:hypothetical protein
MKKCISLLESSVRVAALIASVTPAIAIAQRAPLRTTSFARPLPTSTPASQPTSACQPSWLSTFGPEEGTQGPINAWAVFDDGSGPALYGGGSFGQAGGVVVSDIAKWDGWNWSPLGSGTAGAVNALAVFDDGNGPALYAGGGFTSAGGVAANNIAKWNGSSWSALGTGLSGGSSPSVSALTVFDDGNGPALFAGGSFTTAGGAAVNYVAKWNGSSWSPLAMGLDHGVLALTTFDDGSGTALYAGGYLAGGIVKWNGAHWSAVGGGMNYDVESLAVFDDGSGAALYAAGRFTTAGGGQANNIAKWNGSSWSPLGSGITGPSTYVDALGVFDDGSGAALYAGGLFTHAGGVAASDIAKWNGSSWSALGTGLVCAGCSVSQPLGAKALAVFDDGSGLAMYASGTINTAGGVPVSYVARWNGSSWSPVGSGLNFRVYALAEFDSGGGPDLYVGGAFTAAGAINASCIAKWNGSSWSALGSGVSMTGSPVQPYVGDLISFDDGSGPALYVSGRFNTAGGSPASYIAKWDGANWSPVGSGFDVGVGALAVFDDGSGPALYASVAFTNGGVTANNIAKWNGSSWSLLGSGFDAGVGALAVFDDGGGPALYAGGGFTSAGGVAANDIAKWNGSSWSALGGGMHGLFTNGVFALAVYDAGSAPALYAGGYFNSPASNIAKWNGSSWSALGSGTDLSVASLAVFDDGSGPSLIAGGAFTTAGGSPAHLIAKWNGSSWSQLGNGILGSGSDWIYALTVFDHAGLPALIVGGSFGTSPAGDSFVAEWANAPGCGMPGVSVCEPGVSGVIACPCGNPPSGGGSGCNNSSNTGGASLTASGIARLAYDTVVFTTGGERPTATSIVLQGDNSHSNGVSFGQGVRCVGGALKRLYVKTAVAGSITAPQGSDPLVHVRSAALGDTISAGTHRFYGVYYRDPIVLGGCPAASTFNITQQLDVLWML